MNIYIELLPILVIYFYSTLGNSTEHTYYCDENKCYDNVNKTYNNLLDLVGLFNATNFSKPVDYNSNILHLTNKAINISHNTNADYVRLNKTVPIFEHNLQRYVKNKKLLDDIREKLDSIPSVLNNTIELIKTEELIRKKVEFARGIAEKCQNTGDECNKTKKLSEELIKNVEDIFAEFETVTESYEKVLSKINDANNNSLELFSETANTQIDFDKLRIPYEIVEQHVCLIGDKINQTLNYLNTNKNILKTIFETMRYPGENNIKPKIDEVKAFLLNLELWIISINSTLATFDKNIPKISYNKTIDNSLLDLIDLLKNKLIELTKRIDQFKNKFENMKQMFNEEFDTILNHITENIKALKSERQKLKEYKLFLNTIRLSKDKQNEIAYEIEKMKISLRLLKEKNELQEELNKVKYIVMELQKTKKCPIDITIEDQTN